ncbi:hypothetical protein ACQ4PT_043311 [Festuca glaucescens]
MAAPAPYLVEEILEEILIRVPTSAALARASTACASFRRIITARPFLRRYRKLHPPPLLGFAGENGGFDPVQEPHPSAPLARALADAADFSYSYVPKPDESVTLCTPPGLPATCATAASSSCAIAGFAGQRGPSSEKSSRFAIPCHGGKWCMAASHSWSSFGTIETSGEFMLFLKYIRGCLYWTAPEGDKLLVLDTCTMEFSTVNILTSCHMQLINLLDQSRWEGNESIIMEPASFLLNYDHLLSDPSGIATNNKGKAISNPFVLTNQIYSTVPGEREDRSMKSWIPPTENSIKISVDAAFKKETGDAAIGVAAWDHSGALVAALSQTTSRCQSVEEAEAKALLAGFQMGIDLNLNVSVLESDCLAVVSAVNDPSPNRSIIWSIYKDIGTARSMMSGCLVCHTRRELNMVAHELAKAATAGVCKFWLADFPPVLAELAKCDAVNIVHD